MTVSYQLTIRAQISRAKFRQILKLFALDLTAVQIAELTHLNRNTVNRYLTFIRRAIAWLCLNSVFCLNTQPTFGTALITAQKPRASPRKRGSMKNYTIK
jgi:hypothetical protein